MRDEFAAIKSGRRELREFGVVVGAIAIVLGDIALLRGRAAAPYLIGSGALLALFGVLKPDVLKPLQKAWMALAVILGFFMSRLVLAILFFGVLTPIGLVMRLAGKDLLDERIDRARPSYWREHSTADRTKESYENQY